MNEELIKKYLIIGEGTPVRFRDIDPDDTGGMSKKSIKEEYKKLHTRFDRVQDLFYASKKYGLLIVLQGMDCSGKDGTVKKTFDGVNPNGFYVEDFKEPTTEELKHDYLWRIHAKVPRKGDIVVFNRSYYEDVLVTRVHGTVDDKMAKDRFEQIREYEKYLVGNNIILLKFMLHISNEFQREKLQRRLEKPEKHWKFSTSDLKEREHWEQYQQYYAQAISNCSSPWAPWYVVPSDHRWFRNYLVLKSIVSTLESLDLGYPDLDGDIRELIRQVRQSK